MSLQITEECAYVPLKGIRFKGFFLYILLLLGWLIHFWICNTMSPSNILGYLKSIHTLVLLFYLQFIYSKFSTSE